MDEIKTAIFDLDDTLIKRYTDQFLPGVEEYFRDLGRTLEKPKVCIASNAGYIGLRYWREQVRANGGDIGDPDQTPPLEFFNQNLWRICRNLTNWSEISMNVYRCFRYQSKAGNWSPIPEGEEDNPEWSEWWRKPNPGMLFQAMRYTGFAPAETEFVGDQATDEEAAHRAGCRFRFAWEFFGREKPRKEDEQYTQEKLI